MSIYYESCPSQYFQSANRGMVKISIGEMICSRKKPHVKIAAQSALSYTVPNNAGVLLVADIRYEEFAMRHEKPIYSMKIFQEIAGQERRLLDEIELSTEDQPYYFNPYTSELRFKPKNLDEWQLGDEPLVFICVLEVVLLVTPWPHQEGRYKAEPPERKQKSVRLILQRGETAPLEFGPFVSDHGALFAIPWNSRYKLLLCAQSKGSADYFADRPMTRMMYWEQNLVSPIPTRRQIRLRTVPEGDSPLYPAGRYSDDTGQEWLTYKLHSEQFANDWEFWIDADWEKIKQGFITGIKNWLVAQGIPELAATIVANVAPYIPKRPPSEYRMGLPGPFEKSFRYTYELTTEVCEDEATTFMDEAYIDIYVPPDKIRHGRYAMQCIQDIWACYYFDLGLTFAPWYVSMPFTYYSYAQVMAAKQYVEKMLDPVEYDKGYKSLPNDVKYQTKLPKEEKLPEVARVFYKTYFSIDCVKRTCDVLFNRYLSAIKNNDKRAAGLQQRQAEKLLATTEDTMLSLHQRFSSFLQFLNSQQTQISSDYFKAVAKEIKKRGLSEDNIAYLKAQKLSTATIKNLEKLFLSVAERNLSFDVTSHVKTMYEAAQDMFFSTLRQVKEIQAISRMSKNDVLRNLLKYNLVTPDQFHQQLDRKNLEKSYPLNEIVSIDGYCKKKLREVEISTTHDLVRNCEKPTNRSRVAKITGISNKQLKEWVSMADLMQLPGVGEQQAIKLVEAGFTSSKQLAKTTPNLMKNKLKSLPRKKGQRRSAPTIKQLQSWAKAAKKI